MGDEDTPESKGKLPQRKAKIIIRKCKKSSTASVSKSTDEPNKINGELLTENKGKAGKDDDEVEIIEPREQDATSFTKGIKRKFLEVINPEDDCIIIEDDPPRIENKKDDGSEGKEESSSTEFKGFKKRIIAQTEKLKDDNTENTEQVTNDSTNSIPIQESDNLTAKVKIVKANKGKKKVDVNGKKGSENDTEENQAESQAEYAQYLGLQPTMQFKCYRCGEKGFPSMFALNLHQRGCGVSQKSNFIANLQQDTATMTSSDPNMLTNFRITRKVYLCSACGTYYENWNLFLHMRDVHKKHICLYCLTMFTVANKLADHLKLTHSVQENSFKSSEEFQNVFKGSCYLICCSCENMFTERDDYHHHRCVKGDPTVKCNLCGVKCGHYYTCPNSNLPRAAPISVSVSQPPTLNKSPATNHNKLVPKGKNSEAHWMGKKNQGGLSSDNDEDYDISHAASFCHVDIGDESGEKDKIGTEDNPIDITNDDETPNSNETQSETSNELTKVGNCVSELSVIAEVGDDNKEKEESTPANDTTDAPEGVLKETESTMEKENVTTDESHKEYKNEEKNINEEKHATKENTAKPSEESENLNEIENIATELENKEDNLLQEADGKLEEKKQMDNEDPEELTNRTNSNETNLPEETLGIENEIKNNDTSKSDNDKSQYPTHVEKADSASSDTDGEQDTHLSAGQNDSDSSSDVSSDGEGNDSVNEKSVIKNKDDSVCESDDSDTSGLVVDEKEKTHNEISRSNENKTLDTASGDDSLIETKSNTSNEASKDFQLDDVSSVEKLSEKNVSENGSGDCPDEPMSSQQEVSDGIHLAGEDVPAMALTLEDKLEDASPQAVVKECVRTSCLNCVYCSHAIKIAVNGKQLALHLLGEHRYKPIKNNETSQDVVKKLKNSLEDLENLFFNTDSYDSSDKTSNAPYDNTYECFQCRFVTKVHKELYIHKRKMHQKTVLLCVMCKSNFYSYSELLCHMCPGIYVSEDINFRCCFCSLDMIPSAFRLMVHLRKSHHTCDICLEVAGDQQKLSTHMWKHKLNHLCYRCGIAYRNKPDITKHLFWKHGTESVLCKKCLQKKWPHVYHFCIPPTVFICEECNASFTKAVALKVHKRYHGGELPYGCSKCEQKFVSKKLLAKHETIHNQPPPTEKITNESDSENKLDKSSEEHINVETIDEPSGGNSLKDSIPRDISNEEKAESHTDVKSKKKKKKDKDRKGKNVIDFNFPPLNLSSESDSSDEETKTATSETAKENQTLQEPQAVNKDLETLVDKPEVCSSETTEPSEENQAPAPIVDGVWDNFHNYRAELEKRESKDLSLPNILPSTSSAEPKTETPKAPEPEQNWFLLDHSYCLIPGKPKPSGEEEETTMDDPVPSDQTEKTPEEIPAPRGHSSSIDHAYATPSNSNAESTSKNTVEPEQPSLEEPPSTPPAQTTLSSEPPSSSKKKQKTPKKKKHTNSSSSSDSSSDSDSSSCTCGTNCSCSSSSSNSSTSSSSESGSSTSEGRRRAAAKKEKKKERLKHKHHKEETEPVPEISPSPPPPPPPPLKEEPAENIPVEPIVLPIRESDLDTDESSTDEDFYDKCPQSHAKQQIENRNKLMLLASVAPVNNGTVSPPPPPPPPVEETPPPPPPSAKRKVKTKRRRKSQQSKKATGKTPTQLQQQIHTTSANLPIATSTPSHVTSNHQNIVTKAASPLRTPVATFQSDATAGSGSENESARLSKRKRVRNKFYGYSSDEEDEKPTLKWRKAETGVVPQIQTPGLSFQPSFTHQRPQLTIPPVKKKKHSESSETEEERVIKRDVSSNSSSSSSESESEVVSKDNVQKEQTEKSDNLYCYCQCPYDEVSEMIACDGQDCTIEWFHFECVGIMVPPKGKWYCPDCRKRRDLM